jgi:hypothetical protein
VLKILNVRHTYMVGVLLETPTQRNRPVPRRRSRWYYIIKSILQKQQGDYGQNLCGSVDGQTVIFCDRCAINYGEIRDYLNNYRF